VVLVSLAIVFFGTFARRGIKPHHVSSWFYGALVIVVAMLHIGNSLALPAGLWKSYSLFAGSKERRGSIKHVCGET
jgi:cytochrome c oxidase cbb3-type subunit 1